MNQELKYLLILLSLIVNLLALSVFATSNIDSNYKYAWSSTSSWLNFQPTHGGMIVYLDHLEGDAWSEQGGWIQLGSYNGGGTYHYENTSSTNWGVNQDSTGQLSGYAWSDTLGWINFNPSHGQVIINQENGDFQGSAWSEIGGWIRFKQDEAPTYKVRYNPTETPIVVEPPPPSPNNPTETMTVVEPLPISDEVTGTLNIGWQTISDKVTIKENANISHVIFENNVTNEGIVSNFKVAQGATFEGGKITGYITNEGTIANVEFVGAELRGGILSDTIINSGQGVIKDVQLAPNTTIIGGKVGGTITCDSSSTLHDVQLTAGTILSGCQLSGDISSDPDQPTQIDNTNQIAPGTKLSYVLLSPTVSLPTDIELGPGVTLLIDPDQLTAEQVAKIPPPVFAAIQAKQLARFSKDAVSGIRPEQLAYLPLETLGGLTHNNMGGLSIAVLHDMTSKQVSALNETEFKHLSSREVSKLFVNFDKNQIRTQDVEQLVPPNWQLDSTTGALQPPVGAQLTLATLPMSPSLPVQIPETIDIKQGVGLGGAGTSLKEGMESSMRQQNSLANQNLTEFELSQTKNSILLVEGMEGSSSEGKKYTFVPDADSVIQVDTDKIPIGLAVGIDGFYTITTPDGQQFRVLPAPQDPVMLSQALDEGEVVMGQSGEVLMIPGSQVRQRAATQNGPTAAIFDPEVKKASNDQKAGMYLEGDQGYIVYENHTTQAIHPSFFNPDTFEETAINKFDNLQNLFFKVDGSFTGLLKNGTFGDLYVAKPIFPVTINPVIEGDSVESNLELEGNNLTYTLVMDTQGRSSIRKRMTRDLDLGMARMKQTATVQQGVQAVLEDCGPQEHQCFHEDCQRMCEEYNSSADFPINCEMMCAKEQVCIQLCSYVTTINDCNNRYCR